MNLGPYVLPALCFVQPWFRVDHDFVIVDLSQTGPEITALHLPPVPVIGIGAPSHPLAGQLDMLVPTEEAAFRSAQNILANPMAAALLVQLLRRIEKCSVAEGLHLESLTYSVLQGGAEHGSWLGRPREMAAHTKGNICVERRDAQMTIHLDRPDAHNQIDRFMRDQLREAFELGAMDDDIHRISLTGAGRSFSLGADLGEFGSTRDPAAAHLIRLATLPAHAIAACADKLHVHVQGACVGSGLEMAAFARHITATQKAWFQLPELAMGIIPGAGGCVSVTRRIGRAKAAQMILSGQRISALTALEWGLVDALVAD